MAEIKERILKDVDIFYKNFARVDITNLEPDEIKIVELSEMYAKDSKAWLNKKDYYTSFASISYANGLLDAILKMHSVID